jgi:DNA-binding NarL/FixJ family response regulator
MPPERKIRLVVVDDHPLFVLGIRSLLAENDEIDLVGEGYNGEHALELTERLQPDLLLLDLMLPRITGLEVLQRLSMLKLDTKTVIMTAAIDRTTTRNVLIRGARGVLLKHTASELLCKCTRHVMRGEYWLGRDDVGDLVDSLRMPRTAEQLPSGLTQRELDIIAGVSRSASNKEIAWQLGVGEQTIKNHLRRIFEKLNVANRVELALYVVEHKLVPSRDEGQESHERAS